jgi:hypothetical protein
MSGSNNDVTQYRRALALNQASRQVTAFQGSKRRHSRQEMGLRGQWRTEDGPRAAPRSSSIRVSGDPQLRGAAAESPAGERHRGHPDDVAPLSIWRHRANLASRCPEPALAAGDGSSYPAAGCRRKQTARRYAPASSKGAFGSVGTALEDYTRLIRQGDSMRRSSR